MREYEATRSHLFDSVYVYLMHLLGRGKEKIIVNNKFCNVVTVCAKYTLTHLPDFILERPICEQRTNKFRRVWDELAGNARGDRSSSPFFSLY